MATKEAEPLESAKEPELVGGYSGLVNDRCENLVGETRSDVEQCGAEATHSVVFGTGAGTYTLAMCDECGEPEDAEPKNDREWTGQLIDR